MQTGRLNNNMRFISGYIVLLNAIVLLAPILIGPFNRFHNARFTFLFNRFGSFRHSEGFQAFALVGSVFLFYGLLLHLYHLFVGKVLFQNMVLGFVLHGLFRFIVDLFLMIHFFDIYFSREIPFLGFIGGSFSIISFVFQGCLLYVVCCNARKLKKEEEKKSNTLKFGDISFYFVICLACYIIRFATAYEFEFFSLTAVILNTFGVIIGILRWEKLSSIDKIATFALIGMSLFWVVMTVFLGWHILTI